VARGFGSVLGDGGGAFENSGLVGEGGAVPVDSGFAGMRDGGRCAEKSGIPRGDFLFIGTSKQLSVMRPIR